MTEALSTALTTTEDLATADRRTAEVLRAAVRARGLDRPEMPTVPVGPFAVADATREQVVDVLEVAWRQRQGFVAFALHVGGLLERGDELFVAAMGWSDLVYADGVSIVSLARTAGAERIERAATTDIGIDLLERLDAAGHRPRVALVGGPDGLADRAAAALEARFDLDVVFTTHGFHDVWDGPLVQLREAEPDLVVVGLGAPREMRWVHRHRESLDGALVLTCGGWFGFLAGEEVRAPRLVQRLHGEWVWRWVQQPRRLARRYVLGALVCLKLKRTARAAARDTARRKSQEPVTT